MSLQLIDNRGFMTANGQPDQSRAARYILKDYVNGRLLYCVAPPTVEQSIFQQYSARIRKEIAEEELPEQRLRALRVSSLLLYILISYRYHYYTQISTD